MEISNNGTTETLDDGKMEKLKDGTIAFAGQKRCHGGAKAALGRVVHGRGPDG